MAGPPLNETARRCHVPVATARARINPKGHTPRFGQVSVTEACTFGSSNGTAARGRRPVGWFRRSSSTMALRSCASLDWPARAAVAAICIATEENSESSPSAWL
jgi:hypothetical protein